MIQTKTFGVIVVAIAAIGATIIGTGIFSQHANAANSGSEHCTIPPVTSFVSCGTNPGTDVSRSGSPTSMQSSSSTSQSTAEKSVTHVQFRSSGTNCGIVFGHPSTC